MTATTTEKPSYLGLLNAIAFAETRAHEYLTAWAEVTPDPDVRAVLCKVALREGEHGDAFAKRINELGYEVRETEDPSFEKSMAIVRSDASDLEKIEARRPAAVLHTGDEPDIFDGFFQRPLDRHPDRRAARPLHRRGARHAPPRAGVQGAARSRKGSSGAASDRLASLEDKVDAVCRAVDELRQIVCAQSMPAESV